MVGSKGYLKISLFGMRLGGYQKPAQFIFQVASKITRIRQGRLTNSVTFFA